MSSRTKSAAASRLSTTAGPEIYRTNAFRILGLPISVSERKLARRIQELELINKFGGSVTPDIATLGLGRVLQNDEIREAAQRFIVEYDQTH